MLGTIATVKLEKGFGFIQCDDCGEEDCFFHHSVLSDDLEFDARLEEMRVEYEQTGGDRGPRAIRVSAAKG